MFHVNCNTYPVVARQAFETQRRRGLVTAQDNIAVIVVKVEVQVADGRFIRRAGNGGHPFGPYRQADEDTAGILAFCPVLGDAAPQQQDGSEYQQKIFFHSRKNLKKGLKTAPAREGREAAKTRGLCPQFDVLRNGRLPIGDGDRYGAILTYKTRDIGRDTVVAVSGESRPRPYPSTRPNMRTSAASSS